MSEAHETRLRRLRMRSWRRGMKEMDMILGGFADDRLAELDAKALDAHEALMAEGDQQLYAWITGREQSPEHHSAALNRILANIGEIKSI